MGQTTYNNYEKGFRPALDGAMQLVAAFNLSLDWIYYGNPAGLPTAVWERIRNYEAGSAPVDGRYTKIKKFRRRRSDP